MEHSKGNSKGKFMVIISYIKNQERSQINNLMLYLKEPEKEEQTGLEVRRK